MAVKTQVSLPWSQSFWFSRSGKRPENCHSNKFPGDSDSGETFGNRWLFQWFPHLAAPGEPLRTTIPYWIWGTDSLRFIGLGWDSVLGWHEWLQCTWGIKYHWSRLILILQMRKPRSQEISSSLLVLAPSVLHIVSYSPTWFSTVKVRGCVSISHTVKVQ